jgi:uncharacterized protein (TIGR03000 family)
LDPIDNSVYYNSSYGVTAPSHVDGYTSITAPPASYQAYYPPATGTGQSDSMAQVTVKVPANAKVWFDDTPTTSTGSTREFESPPLTPGQQYSYAIRASWNQDGHEVTQTKQVEVTAGSHVNVDFAASPKAAAQASAASKS